MTRNPSRSYANPYNACTTCGVRVYWWDSATGNDPCGHRGSDREVSAVSIGKKVTWNEHTDAWKSVCPSWGPVDGCRCSPSCALPPDRDPSQTSTDVDDVPDASLLATDAQSAATGAGRAADAPGPYPSSALPSDGA